MRFFTEFTLSQWQRFFTSFRMTGEGFRMTGEGFRMTSMAFPSLRHTLRGERIKVRGVLDFQTKGGFHERTNWYDNDERKSINPDGR
jgi:hypothetical protein